jgi:hypothetical protein
MFRSSGGKVESLVEINEYTLHHPGRIATRFFFGKDATDTSRVSTSQKAFAQGDDPVLCYNAIMPSFQYYTKPSIVNL